MEAPVASVLHNVIVTISYHITPGISITQKGDFEIGVF
jgi:hypothetical protein